MRWFRSREQGKLIQDMRQRIVALRRQIDVHERQIAQLEEHERTAAEPEPWSDRLDAYLGHMLPMLVLGGVASAIAVVTFFTVESVQRQLLIALALVVGVVALVIVQWVGRRLAAGNQTGTQRMRDRSLALGLYVVGIVSLVGATMLIALD